MWRKLPLDEMWSFVSSKRNPRWLWHAIDRRSGQVLAYVFGRRKDNVFLNLKKLLEPFGIHRYCTDGWGAYERYLPAEAHEVGLQHSITTWHSQNTTKETHPSNRPSMYRMCHVVTGFRRGKQRHKVLSANI